LLGKEAPDLQHSRQLLTAVAKEMPLTSWPVYCDVLEDAEKEFYVPA